MPKKIIVPAGLPKPIAPYSPGVLANGILYVSGTLAINEDGTVASPGDAAGQTRHILQTIEKIIKAAGGSLDDVTFNQVFVADWAYFAPLNAVYAEFFPGDKPARYCIQCGLVKPDYLVEIASTAHIS